MQLSQFASTLKPWMGRDPIVGREAISFQWVATDLVELAKVVSFS